LGVVLRDLGSSSHRRRRKRRRRKRTRRGRRRCQVWEGGKELG